MTSAEVIGEYLNLSRKNAMELEAEVEYWREKSSGLEAEVKGVQMERDWY